MDDQASHDIDGVISETSSDEVVFENYNVDVPANGVTFTRQARKVFF